MALLIEHVSLTEIITYNACGWCPFLPSPARSQQSGTPAWTRQAVRLQTVLCAIWSFLQGFELLTAAFRIRVFI